MEALKFNRLTYEEKDELLFAQGIKLGLLTKEWNEIDLYRLGSLLVEHRFIKDHDLDEIRAFGIRIRETEPYRFLLN